MLSHSTKFYPILFHTILFSSILSIILFYLLLCNAIPLNLILFYPILFHTILFYLMLFYFLLYRLLFYPIPLNSILSHFIPFYSVLMCTILHGLSPVTSTLWHFPVLSPAFEKINSGWEMTLNAQFGSVRTCKPVEWQTSHLIGSQRCPALWVMLVSCWDWERSILLCVPWCQIKVYNGVDRRVLGSCIRDRDARTAGVGLQPQTKAHGDIRKFSEIFGNLWQSSEIFGNFWKSSAIFGISRKSLEIFGNLWKSSEILHSFIRKILQKSNAIFYYNRLSSEMGRSIPRMGKHISSAKFGTRRLTWKEMTGDPQDVGIGRRISCYKAHFGIAAPFNGHP